MRKLGITFAITAGGTSEPIDNVRRITNMSTGALGWMCMEAVVDAMTLRHVADYTIYYIHTDTAITHPLTEQQREHVEMISVSDAASVFEVVDNLCQSTAIDYFIHSMAISDFTYAYSAPQHLLAEEIHQRLAENPHLTADEIEGILSNPCCAVPQGGKMSSSADMVMGLKRTRKVIPLIKAHNPNTFLVGFKLLSGVTDSDLKAVADRLALHNDCDMVFANEVSRIDTQNHTGMLIANGKVIDTPVGKRQVAQSIVINMLNYSNTLSE